jgi:para-nitrobenzyl esterase
MPFVLHAKRDPVANAPVGQIQGTTEGTLHVFKGIPYALPPVGSARWKPPVPVPAWSGVRKATEFGPACCQPQPQLSVVYADYPLPMSEDCLTLNIWAPANAQDAPVLIWVHGGALSRGASREGLYDGAQLAARGVVVVTINYRVGVFGFLAHPELSAESPSGISGNYGLLDQIEALRWVQHNIGAFGGDASNVTIAGESAGALTVMYLMASPDARGLFAKVIAQSAYMISMPELKQRRFATPSAEESGVRLAALLHAPDIAALREMDAKTLSESTSLAGFAPWLAIDGQVIPRQLVDTFDKGEQAPVPILAGFNSGEVRSLRVLAPSVLASADAYERIIHERYRDLADAFLRLYPGSDMAESILAATRDALYGWTAERLVRKQTALGQPSYLYVFDHGYPAADEAGLRAFHASEVPFVFGTFDGTPPLWPVVPKTPVETRLSNAMIGYWTSFARAGQPQAAGEPAWPVYGQTAAHMAFKDVPVAVERLLPGMFAFNEKVVCRRRAADQAWNWNVGLWSPNPPGPGS